MKRIAAAGVLVLCLLSSMASGQESDAVLKVGDKAPDFTLVGTDGKTYALKDFAGKQAVVIAWYPKAATAG